MREINTEHGIFTDLLDKDGNVVKKAEEVYQEWLNPKPIEPSKTDILSKEVEELKAENKLLNAQVNALSTTTDFHEDLIAEMAMLVYA